MCNLVIFSLFSSNLEACLGCRDTHMTSKKCDDDMVFGEANWIRVLEHELNGQRGRFRIEGCNIILAMARGHWSGASEKRA